MARRPLRPALALLAALLMGPVTQVLGDDAALRAWLDDWLVQQAGEADAGATSTSIVFYDLDGQGEAEAIVYLVGRYWCGSGGCDALVLRDTGAGYDIVMHSSVTGAPIGVLSTSTQGWRDLFVQVGGGGLPAGAVAMRFDGTAYPSNPTVAGDPLEPGFKGKVLIADD